MSTIHEQFCRNLFNTQPSKTGTGCARLEVADPSLNLSLIPSEKATGHGHSTSHFGIQVKSAESVSDAQRLEPA
jgi:hypothetical protein